MYKKANLELKHIRDTIAKAKWNLKYFGDASFLMR